MRSVILIKSIKNNRSVKHLAIILFVMFLFMFLLNSFSPLVFDDYAYFVKTTSIKTILADEYHQYMTWTGRSVVHVIFRLFTKLPKVYFNLFNALMFVTMVYQMMAVASISKEEMKKNIYLKALLIFALLWVFTPSFNDVYLWMAGSVNYLTAMVIMLAFVLFYHRYTIEAVVKKHNPYKIAGIFLLGIIAGWCNENTSGGTLVIVLGYTAIARLYKKKKIEKWMVAGIIGNIIGYLFMVMAPGNDIRATYFDRSKLTFIWKIIDALPNIAGGLRENAMFPLTIALALIVFSYLTHGPSIRNILSSLFYIIGLLTIGVLAISPTAINWSRSYFGGIIFILISLVMSLCELLLNFDKVNKLIFSGILGYISVLFILLFFIGSIDIYRNHVSYSRQAEAIKTQMSEGKEDIVVPALDYKPKTRYPKHSDDDITADKNNERNKNVAAYWGVKSIRLED